MLRSVKELYGYRILTKDGDIGWVHDFLFDDRSWIIRYLVGDVGTWLPGRKVLLVPSSLGDPEWETNTFPVHLAKQQVKESPDINMDKPVSRQHEEEIHKYFGWGPYWVLEGRHGMNPVSAYHPEQEGRKGNPSLRSAKKVSGYRIQATDGEIGHVEEFIMDDSIWKIRYVVVDTRNFLPGKKVLVSPYWIEEIRWEDSNVSVDLSKGKIEGSPRYDASAPVNRRYEERLYDYYGRPKYWE